MIKIDRVSRSFGADQALKAVTLEIAGGELHSLLGPNGAGKTTLSKIVSGLLLPDSGSVAIGGHDMATDARLARASVGLVLGGDGGFYGRATARDNLLFFADVAGLSSQRRRPRVEAVLESVALADQGHKRVREYSRGMKQRLHLARALLAEPPALVLDEVTSGLDPEVAVEIRSLIRSLRTNGTAILHTTHLLGEVESLASKVSLLRAGEVAFSGTVDDLVAISGVGYVTTFSSPDRFEAVQAQLAPLPRTNLASEVRESMRFFTLSWTDKPDEEGVVKLLGHRPADLVSRAATLEEAYLVLVQAREDSVSDA
ncbi:ABC transporter ATP-binding protein [Pseudoclavibacter sp. RFBJ3]|uniref:ABC transporter ATP-binding protein n=1 Tax=unclassified Pseudoclavibacter TaxID=2615177 RepID=UPI000CE9258C|nr:MULTISPECIES: ABC transporter ATP-binding protein [unclassified Pseudoclavibacter]PPF74892.1 ABC transporter ATP-binding protein [Pseudoclavibacter sp. Z016]PPF83907.1 ABC transporter ATP-binding protein [Pseudoclavibacter sp. RFBJ5]PPF92187.1 ABC transporter ATP-binding protein [Pseudoclavibacter sp. RFBJ3]PPF97050.1 ABC transporter ATP-binding protein [Pseudoclavibacter sp. RFBH5]PPG23737.1 ABC transporter ATP-binding protein [Pseudoclavibacter sp. RFBI4]